MCSFAGFSPGIVKFDDAPARGARGFGRFVSRRADAREALKQQVLGLFVTPLCCQTAAEKALGCRDESVVVRERCLPELQAFAQEWFSGLRSTIPCQYAAE